MSALWKLSLCRSNSSFSRLSRSISSCMTRSLSALYSSSLRCRSCFSSSYIAIFCRSYYSLILSCYFSCSILSISYRSSSCLRCYRACSRYRSCSILFWFSRCSASLSNCSRAAASLRTLYCYCLSLSSSCSAFLFLLMISSLSALLSDRLLCSSNFLSSYNAHLFLRTS